MKKDYECIFDINFQNGGVEIHVFGDGQVIKFEFMLAFIAIPWFFGTLLYLWTGKRQEVKMDGLGFAEKYQLNVEGKNLLIEHQTEYQSPKYFYEKGTYSHYHYKFNFKQFVKAVDQGFSDYLKEQVQEGRPIHIDETSYPLSSQVIEEYNTFSTTIKS